MPEAARASTSLRTLATLVAITFREAPGVTVLGLTVVPLGWLTHQMSVVWLKYLTDAVVAQQADRALMATVLIVVTLAASWLTYGLDFKVRPTIQERAGFAIDHRITSVAAALPGLEHFERPEFHDNLELLRQQQGFLGNAMNAVVYNVVMVVQFVFTLALLASLHPLMLLLPFAGIPRIVATTAKQSRMRRVEDETAEPARRAEHLLGLGTHPEPGKELRVFNLEREVARRYAQAWRDRYRAVMRTTWIAAALTTAALVVESVAFLAGAAFIGVRALDGVATAGDVLLTVGLTAQLSVGVSQAGFLTGWLLASLRTAGRFMWLLDYSAAQTTPQRAPLDVPDRIADAITLEGVSFSYPGTDVPVLRDVDLRLPAGSVVALVGENGAGKTTLVKLLCRFYDPTSGRIALDGSDLKRFAHEDWRVATTAAFQDFAKLELLARQAVGVGFLPQIDDEPAVVEALHRAGASEVPATLTSGLSTQLGRQWTDGVELSIGQWQKLALARALMRPTPLLCVFDEPTASLDAETEHALFERFAAAARVNRALGMITVLVSHRFSTVRGADLIVVIDDGRVVEQGSHEELIAAGGLYAELYELQAHAYR